MKTQKNPAPALRVLSYRPQSDRLPCVRLLTVLLLSVLLLSGCGVIGGADGETVVTGGGGEQSGTGNRPTEDSAADTTGNGTAADGATEDSPVRENVSFFAMDTFMDFAVYGNRADAEAAKDAVTRIEALASATDPDSEIYRVNHRESGTVSETSADQRENGTAVTVSDETADLLAAALDLCAVTDGALDISIYPVVRAWGFTTGDNRIPSDAELSALLERVDYRKIRLDGNQVSLPDGMEIDLGGVAKGYAGARAADLLRERGVTSALLSLGGNVQAVGAKPDGSLWRVAVQDPDLDGYAGIVEVADLAVVTSGGYQRFFTGPDGEVYWHIMDPSTGRPAKSGLRSVTVAARDGAYCDALSTALFVMGPERAADFWRSRQDFGMVLITEDNRILVTPDLSFTPGSPEQYRMETLE